MLRRWSVFLKFRHQFKGICGEEHAVEPIFAGVRGEFFAVSPGRDTSVVILPACQGVAQRACLGKVERIFFQLVHHQKESCHFCRRRVYRNIAEVLLKGAGNAILIEPSPISGLQLLFCARLIPEIGDGSMSIAFPAPLSSTSAMFR